MKRLLFILFSLLVTFDVSGQVASSRSGSARTFTVTNNLSDIGWQRDASANVFLFTLTDFVGIGIADPTVDLHLFSVVGSAPHILLEDENADNSGPRMTFFKDSTSPADGDRIGNILFQGDDSGANTFEYVKLQFRSQDVTDTDEAGQIEFFVAMDSVGRELFTIEGFNGTVNQGQIIFNEESQDIDIRMESDNDVNALFIEGNTGDIGIGTGSPDAELHIINSGSAAPDLHLENTNNDAVGSILRFEKNGTSPATNDELGRLLFTGDSGGGPDINFVLITTQSEAIGASIEGGQLEIDVMMNGTLRNFINLDGEITAGSTPDEAQIIINDDSRDVNFVVESDDDVNAIHMLGNSGHLGIGGIPDSDKELMLVSQLTTNPNFKIESNHVGAQGGSVEFVLSSSSGNDFDEPGRIEWYSGDAAGTEELVAEIRGVLRDASAGITAGRLWFLIQHNGGVLSEYLTLSGYNGTANQGEIIFNEGGLDVDFRVESDTDPNAFSIISSSGNIGIGTSSPGAALTMGNDNLIARDVNAGLTAGTTQTQAGGLALTAEINEVSIVANVNDTVVLPTAVAGLKIIIINDGANVMRIFPASGNDLGAGNNTQMTTALATTDMITFTAYDATNWRGVRGAYVN